MGAAQTASRGVLDWPPTGPVRPRRCDLTGSTPDALWASSSVQLLRPAAVVCDGVRRVLDGERLLDGLDLAVGVGARLLLVSTPEASASLLLRVLAGLAHATSGIVRIAGVARADDSAAGWARRIGYVGPEAGIHAWMSPGEALDLAGRLAGLDPDERRRRIEVAAELYRLGPQLGTPVRRGGPALAQRTALAAAMLADPEVLLLDEPLRSLEPDERRLMLTIPGRRRTVLLASRYPASEAGLVNQVALLREGRVALHVGVAELDEHDLQLSMRGIEALAELGRGGAPDALAPVGQ
jgi:ABC-type multidrug transport system ATPase subunit